MILPLVYYDSPGLRKKSRPIEKITDEIMVFTQDMVESMIHYNGVGLAAPQVGKLLRVIVIREEFVGDDEEWHLGPPEVLINPVLTAPSQEEETVSEGCLSIPGIHAAVVRPSRIHVRYQTLDRRIVEEDVSGSRARVIMHENDHLNGVLYIDRISSEEREKIALALKKLKNQSFS